MGHLRGYLGEGVRLTLCACGLGTLLGGIIGWFTYEEGQED